MITRMRALLLATLAMSVIGAISLSQSGEEALDRQANAPSPQGVAQVFFGEDEDIHLDKTPPRAVTGLDLKRMGWTYDCMECHRHVDEPNSFQRPMEIEHENIVLEHGNNRFCLNCHHATNRNAFTDYDGAEIPEHDVTLLCAKCHGPKHRDWQAGVHGRQNGYWDASKGPRTKLRCIQCHDPHHPAFAPMKPLPPLVYPSRAPQPANSDPHGH